MLASFDDDFVGTERTHFVVDAFGDAAGFVFDAVERVRMRDNADLPGAFRRGCEEWVGSVDRAAGIEGTRSLGVGWFALAGYNPTLRDGISADFHFLCG